jgi:hypothetical protein
MTRLLRQRTGVLLSAVVAACGNANSPDTPQDPPEALAGRLAALLATDSVSSAHPSACWLWSAPV